MNFAACATENTTHASRSDRERWSTRSAFGGAALAGLLLFCGCGPAPILPKLELVPTEVPAAFDDSDWAAVLRENVRGDLVDYKHLASHRQGLDRFVAMLSVVGPKRTPKLFPTARHQTAYWINAFNALVLYKVLEEYPCESMYGLDRPSLRHGYSFRVDGTPLVLHDAFERLRKASQNDARILFTLCDASRASPPLAPTPYAADTLDRQLADAARRAVNNDQLVRVDRAGMRLLLSQDLVREEGWLVRNYERRTGARGARLLNALLSFTPSARKRAALNGAIGYGVGTIPFDRRLNDWSAVRSASPASSAPPAAAP